MSEGNEEKGSGTFVSTLRNGLLTLFGAILLWCVREIVDYGNRIAILESTSISMKQFSEREHEQEQRFNSLLAAERVLYQRAYAEVRSSMQDVTTTLAEMRGTLEGKEVLR